MAIFRYEIYKYIVMKRSIVLSLMLIFSTLIYAQQKVNFTLHNSGLKSISLKIPGVMNPNLSPISDSGVSLKLGQKIFYKKKRKAFLLIEVDESYEGKRVDVAELLKAFKRKKKQLKQVN